MNALWRRIVPSVRQTLFIGALSGAAGLVYALHQGDMARIAISLAVAQGVMIGVVISAFEVALSVHQVRDWISGLPFSAVLLFRTIIYTAVIVLVNIGMRPSHALASIERGDVFIYFVCFSFFVSLLLNFIVQTANLAGGQTLLNFVTGRYHRPREEKRFVLFVDVVGSMTLAERHGSLFIHQFLDRIFRVLADPVVSHSGEVLGYIGDGMIVTWTEKAGSTGGRPLHCFCEMRAALQRSHKRFRQEFQSIPEVRGSLHFGSLIVGETGALKRAIVFNGDVMNTAARLEESSRFVEGGFVASHTAIQQFKGVLPCRLTTLGYLELRGRTQTVEAYGLGHRPATGDEDDDAAKRNQ